MKPASIARLILAATFAGAPLLASADSFPSRPITIVVPFGAGGGSDVMTRVVAARMAEQMGQAIVVDNKPGGSGIIGTSAVVSAKPDGYTLVMAPSLLAISQASRKSPPYDLEKDLTPVGMLGQTPFVLIASPTLKQKSLKDFIDSAKANPSQHTFGSSGEGALAHLGMEVLKKAAGISVLHVPFKTETQSATEVIAGRVDVMFASMSTALPFIQANKVQAWAIGTPGRSALIPNVPTTAELGYPDVLTTAWYGFLAPSGVPEDVLKKLNTKLRAALASQHVKERLSQSGTEPMDSSIGAAKSVIADELKRWRSVVVSLGLQI